MYMWMYESIRIMYHVQSFNICLCSWCGVVYGRSERRCVGVSFLVVYLGIFRESDWDLMLMIVWKVSLQGWSSWLWRGFHTAEVPVSIPGFCILGLSVIIVVITLRLARWGHRLEISSSNTAQVLVLPVLDYFNAWLWPPHTLFSLETDFRLRVPYSGRAANELLDGPNIA